MVTYFCFDDVRVRVARDVNFDGLIQVAKSNGYQVILLSESPTVAFVEKNGRWAVAGAGRGSKTILRFASAFLCDDPDGVWIIFECDKHTFELAHHVAAALKRLTTQNQ